MRSAVSRQAVPPYHGASAFNNLLSSFNRAIFGARSIEKRGAQEAGKSKECCEPILFACDPTGDPPFAVSYARLDGYPFRRGRPATFLARSRSLKNENDRQERGFVLASGNEPNPDTARGWYTIFGKRGSRPWGRMFLIIGAFILIGGLLAFVFS
ncbi:hypothetical protein [Fulvimarina manganoxydans]|uniref:hypothetical protein n=1 Tax=Fulvimarina manganoxydans TaxID=937218 RepID=UPI002356C4D3|nr:hypothetical protein [Fulvimarina manganoxydans]